ncbi:hypothetical protein AB0I77_40500 [Streptomyces sp. NPDC050619]|uniref:hypothetical protein n=1 Tax=Streptomyces sp. NPDC050619 TaxID=3157214 RepID=UPI00342760DB
MSRFVERMARWLRRATLASGCHHAGQPPAVRCPSGSSYEHFMPPPPRIAATVQAWYGPIDGSATPLVRPYLTAHEREEKARLQRLRRDALWLATYGVDLDTRDIHACLGAAS